MQICTKFNGSLSNSRRDIQEKCVFILMSHSQTCKAQMQQVPISNIPELISEEFQWLNFKDLQKLHKVSEALAQDIFQL